MWSRLGSRWLPIFLCLFALLLANPTPVPLVVVRAWKTARLAAASGDIEAAQQALQEISTFPGWPVAISADDIRLALADGDGERALALLDGFPAPQAPRAVASCWRAEALALVGQWDQSSALLTQPGASDCQAPLPLLSGLATQKVESGETDVAIAILQQLMAIDPGRMEDAALLGACLILEDPDAALTMLRLPAARGVTLAIDLTQAMRDVQLFDRPAVLTATGQVFLQHEMWSLAAEAFRQLVSLEPGSASAHAYYGMALGQAGQEGLAELETAAEMDPASSLAQSLLGLHWQQLGRPQQAIPYLERAAVLDPEGSALLASLAAARAAAGNVQDAIEGYRRAAELRPADPVFWRLLASFSIDREIELFETGLPAARNAVVLDPADPLALELLGTAHALLGGRAVAERLLSRSVLLDPSSASARLRYGLLLSSGGKTNEARAQLTAAVRLGGDDPAGILAQRALAQLGG
jgi:tetratricopeptide (TPR) repeat protein